MQNELNLVSEMNKYGKFEENLVRETEEIAIKIAYRQKYINK